MSDIDINSRRWEWPTTSTARWTYNEIEELKRELSCTARGLDPFFERCADAIGSLQFDLIDAQKHNSVLTDALDNSTRLLHEEAKRLEPSESAWIIAWPMDRQ